VGVRKRDSSFPLNVFGAVYVKHFDFADADGTTLREFVAYIYADAAEVVRHVTTFTDRPMGPTDHGLLVTFQKVQAYVRLTKE